MELDFAVAGLRGVEIRRQYWVLVQGIVDAVADTLEIPGDFRVRFQHAELA